MRMCFMQESRREYASVSYVGKMQDSIIGSFVFLEPFVRYLLLASGSSQAVPKRPKTSQ